MKVNKEKKRQLGVGERKEVEKTNEKEEIRRREENGVT